MRPVPPPATASPTPVPAPGPTAKVPAPIPAAVAEPPAPPRATPPPPRGRRSAYGRRLPRRPWVALPLLVLLALATTFFAWISAEPFWLALGHGHTGTATVIAETGPGGGCRATFAAEGQALSIVDLAGLSKEACVAGVTLPAHMLTGGARAYATDEAGLFLRWGSGFGLVLVCALLIVWVTGATRFTGWRRVTSVALSLAGPLAILIGLVTATA